MEIQFHFYTAFSYINPKEYHEALKSYMQVQQLKQYMWIYKYLTLKFAIRNYTLNTAIRTKLLHFEYCNRIYLSMSIYITFD